MSEYKMSKCTLRKFFKKFRHLKNSFWALGASTPMSKVDFQSLEHNAAKWQMLCLFVKLVIKEYMVLPP
jgi:hypothetical protein